MPWRLSIDVGSSNTRAVVLDDRRGLTEPVEIDGARSVSSCVYVRESGDILVGDNAREEGSRDPARYEASPKHWFELGGEVPMGNDSVAVTVLYSALLHRMFAKACEQQNDQKPSSVCLTHPVHWVEGGIQLGWLREAAVSAGLPNVVFAPEPVAAAYEVASDLEPGEIIGIYDFGAANCSATMLRRGHVGFDIVGVPHRLNDVGGDTIDALLADWLLSYSTGDQVDRGHEAPKPTAMQDLDGFDRARVVFDARGAKELLSEEVRVRLTAPGSLRTLTLRRSDLDRFMMEPVNRTVRCLTASLDSAGMSVNDLAGLYLVGGMSNAVCVAAAIESTLQIRPAPSGIAPEFAAAIGGTALRRPDPVEAKGHRIRGSDLLMQARYAEARAALELGLNIAPNDPELLRLRAKSLVGLGDKENGLQDLNRALAIQPSVREMLSDRITIYLETGRAQQAEVDLTELLVQEPKDAHLLRLRASARRSQDLLDAALQDLSESLAIEPLNSWALGMRGEIRASQGSTTEAIVDLERAVALGPWLGWLQEHLTPLMRKRISGLTTSSEHTAFNPNYDRTIVTSAPPDWVMHKIQSALGSPPDYKVQECTRIRYSLVQRKSRRSASHTSESVNVVIASGDAMTEVTIHGAVGSKLEDRINHLEAAVIGLNHLLTTPPGEPSKNTPGNRYEKRVEVPAINNWVLYRVHHAARSVANYKTRLAGADGFTLQRQKIKTKFGRVQETIDITVSSVEGATELTIRGLATPGLARCFDAVLAELTNDELRQPSQSPDKGAPGERFERQVTVNGPADWVLYRFQFA